MSEQPIVALIGGPNCAGKTTLARTLLPTLGLEHFVNADNIARGMSDDAESVALQAGRAMIGQMRWLVAARRSFAFESTLASRTLARFVANAKSSGFRFLLYYVWVPSADVSISRVASRVAAGGHNVPDEDVRRRHKRSASNFLKLYSPLADGWIVFENPDDLGHRIVAVGSREEIHWISNEEAWNQLQRTGQD